MNDKQMKNTKTKKSISFSLIIREMIFLLMIKGLLTLIKIREKKYIEFVPSSNESNEDSNKVIHFLKDKENKTGLRRISNKNTITLEFTYIKNGDYLDCHKVLTYF